MKFLLNKPALVHYDALIIGDVHFGIEKKLRADGIRVKGVSENLLREIIDIMDSYSLTKLIVAGDIKEDVLSIDHLSEKCIRELGERYELFLVKGNHDGGIEEKDLPIKVIDSDGFVFRSLGIIHGHAWPSQEVMSQKYVLSAHQHPELLIRKNLSTFREKVWLFCPVNFHKAKERYQKVRKDSELLVMPAFNPFVGSPASKKDALGPLLNNNLFKWNYAIVYSLLGERLGRLDELIDEG